MEMGSSSSTGQQVEKRGRVQGPQQVMNPINAGVHGESTAMEEDDEPPAALDGPPPTGAYADSAHGV
eukprot:7685749-Prorocentrum_lima.AAC.1